MIMPFIRTMAAAVCILGWFVEAFSPGYHYNAKSRPPLSLFMAPMPNLDSKDPLVILGLDPTDQSRRDKKSIKRAYKRLALQYHPDVVTTKDSTAEEKKNASDRFAKINAAYETLLQQSETAATTTTKTKTTTDSASYAYTPPHRRPSSSSSSSNANTNPSWEDFMPQYDDAMYDTGGDSLASILADLLAGAAGAVGSRGNIFTDFVDFLERNVDGYDQNRNDPDADLALLLRTGSVDDVGEEMDDTQLVVQQLTTKLDALQNDLFTIRADLAASVRFSERIALEERQAECEARKAVVDDYLKRARKRLLSLQTRYKELIVRGGNDSKAGGRSTSRSGGEATTTTSPRSSTSSSSSSEDAWKTEAFGSSGRGRGSSRRRTSSRSEKSTSSASSSQYNSVNDNGKRPAESRSPPPRPSSSQSPQPMPDYNVPPHRRTNPYTAQDDQARLRELKVDEEFEKLKKELGL